MLEQVSSSEESEVRASLYWWFASTFTKELDKQQLNHYISGEGAALLKNLAEVPELSSAVQRINNGLAHSLAMRHPELELAADFCQLFLTDANTGAPPYASIYSGSKMMFQQPHEDMQALLKQQGMQVDPAFNEPADHLAIQLDYLGNLIIRDGQKATSAQGQFIKQQLLSWLPQWVDSLQNATGGEFYKGFAALLLAYLYLDIQFL
ncbi:molecular chaperone TorD [Agarivorans sp. MS3-6]|uniref:molecular chaperone TorD n=1 Tax=Agarivorans sp. TSD2052 TaxID=2937286 RepID=UPI0020101DBE|nr:molecular chaperone TorD [Agarivorans sp. TSD2052]UPW18454.1 molecular chaperone TorD [Agarivorans sp. TSD2052]